MPVPRIADRTGRLTPLALASLLAGCSDIQSAIAPAGSEARIVDRMGWLMFAGGAFVFAVVAAATLWAIAGPPGRRGWLAGRVAVLAGGVAFPVVVLSALLVYGLDAARGLVAPPADPPLRVAVIGERWWWRVHYLEASGAVAFESANELRVPVGRSVEILLTSADVIHSFWAPNLGGKLDMIPGRQNRLVVRAERAGTYRGQCAEFCGAQHAHMAFDVVAEEPAEFARWMAAQQRPVAPPADPLLRRGSEVFAEFGCGACHTIRGTPAAGVIGPDLTHVGARLSLAAGTLPNNAGALAAWVAHAQGIKPGNLMPSFEVIPGADLRALAAYLESLT